MMAQKHLHELLKEDQEPFLLKNYISDRRSQLLKVHSPKTILQVKKQKPIHQKIQNSSFPVNLCKNACFLSLQNTPDIRKSPLFEFKSPEKSPCRSSNNNTIFIHIPARTASLLLEASLRIQKKSKTKTHNKNNGFGLLGSFFKRLTSRSRSRNREIEGNNNVKVSVKDILRWDSSVGRRKPSNGRGKEQENKDVIVAAASEVCSCEVGFTCSCNGSVVWSETNEDKSMDMETSSSGHSYDSADEEAQFPNKQKEKDECACFDDHGFFCESPFRFVLQKSPSSSSGRRTPEFSSPALSPSRNRTEDNESKGDDSHNKFQSGEEEEEEKEQCSPVSVLDPPFGNDDDDDVHENDEDDEEGGFDLECSYANVQRTKQQLLDRLSRFEKLAELDPIELEKRMLDQEDNEYETFIEEDDSETSCEEEKGMREIVFEILCQSSVHDRKQAPEELKRLVYDLIMEEEREANYSENRDMVIRRVCGRLELWKEVESNTIDMMIEEDLSREEGGWKKNDVQTRDLVGELELALFGFLVEELVC
ncbi:uncharacterized protein LOC133307437 [Gastrolobium bilobum]|uniref:uncharacterized protein LOC133307437 n=1 Tax=Gastrolobium bilobum TaxID=150636 RepID=UPI002AB13CCB|nr:uncharacterized protein LOC133307437 [Gastrolobium bilobum]